MAGGYFEAMGTRLIRGRGINRSDVERQEPVIVINEALVNIAFPNEDPIGQRVRMGNPAVSKTPGWLTVAGVVSNTSFRALAETTPVPMMYMPMFASRAAGIVPPLDEMSYVVRTRVAPQGLAAPARRAISDVDAHLALAQVRTLQETLDRASAQMAFTMVLLVIAASVALLLGIIGIYGAQVDWNEAEGEGQQVAHAIGERSGSVLGLRKHQSDGDPAGRPTGDNSHYQRHGRDNDRDQRGGLALTLPREYEETIVRSCGKAHAFGLTDEERRIFVPRRAPGPALGKVAKCLPTAGHDP